MYESLSNKEILNYILEYKNKYGKAPTRNDMLVKYNRPSYTLYFKRFNVTRWRDVLNILDLSAYQPIHSNEFLLKKLQGYCNILGRLPTFKDFEENHWLPNFNMYYKRFGSYNNALVLAGLKDKNIYGLTKKDATIRELTELSKQLGRIPYVEEYELYKKHGLCHTKFQCNFNKSFIELCKELFPEYSLERFPTLDEIKQIILDFYKQNKRTPYFNELGIYVKSLKNRFNLKYSNLLMELGLPKATTYSDDELLNGFYKIFIQLNRIPSLDEITKYSIVNYTTYINRFGSIKNICEILDIDYNKNYTLGKFCVNKNNELCKSLSEAQISNYFIDLNLEYEIEPKYKELIDGDRRLFDWKIKLNNEWYYVEYFGLWYLNKKGKIIRHYIKNAKKKMVDLYKTNNIDKSIFIFPCHLKNLSKSINNLLEQKGFKCVY